MTKISIAALLGVSMAALALPSIALAQTASAPARTAADADDGIVDIVVTARRVSESVQKVPLAISVVGEAQLRDSSIRGVRDLQGSAPALFITSGAGGPSSANVAIRGQTQADVLLVTDPSVAVYLNEINLPRQIGLRAAFLDVDQVQVLKGPQGTLFGKNTTGGALLLRSRRPDLSAPSGYAQGAMGNLGYIQLTAAASVPLIEDQLAIRIAGQAAYRDGLGRNAIGQQLGNQNEESVRGSLLYEPSDAVRLFVTADYSTSDVTGSVIDVRRVNPFALTPAGAPANALGSMLNEITAELGLPRTPAGYQAAYNAYIANAVTSPGYFEGNGNFPIFGFLRIYGASGDLSVDVGGVTLRAITGYRKTRRNDQQDYDVSQFSIVKPRNYVYSHQFTQELQVVSNGDGPFSWILGAFYSNEKGDEGGVTVSLPAINPASPNIQDYTAKNESIAGFVQANYAFSDTLKATGGFRYTKVTQDISIRNRNGLGGCLVPLPARPDPAVCEALFGTDSAKPSYLASLDWQATPEILLYLKTSSSFRAGGINVRGQSATSVAPFVPFGPERATDYEFGFKGDLFNRHVRLNAAAYYTDYKDIQKSSLTIVNSSLITVINNAAAGEVYGGEVELTVQPFDGLVLNGSLNYTHARYKEFIEANGNDRTNEAFPVPEWQYSVSAKYTLPVGNGDLSLFGAWRWQDDVIYRAEALDDASVGQTAFGLLEGRLAYRINGDPNFEVAVFGKNLLDKKYYTNALNFDSSLGFNIGFVGDPRTVGLELRVGFGGE